MSLQLAATLLGFLVNFLPLNILQGLYVKCLAPFLILLVLSQLDTTDLLLVMERRRTFPALEGSQCSAACVRICPRKCRILLVFKEFFADKKSV